MPKQNKLIIIMIIIIIIIPQLRYLLVPFITGSILKGITGSNYKVFSTHIEKIKSFLTNFDDLTKHSFFFCFPFFQFNWFLARSLASFNDTIQNVEQP